MKGQYQPAIDGLRALAVLSVFVYHLDHRWLGGGFAGVDVFFVLSGYLISSIILRDCEAGTFSLARFYQRRIARIFPAFCAVALSAIAVASIIYLPQDFASAGANLAAAMLSVANIKYMLQGNYFEISPDAQPFMHCWSLSVEEQFYLFFPVSLWLLFRYLRNRIPFVLGIVSMASVAASVVLTRVRPVWAFYLLPTRAFELLSGCILSVYSSSVSGLAHERLRRVLPYPGIVAVFASFSILQEGNSFPGYSALLPVLGTVLVLCGVGDRQNAIVKALSLSPLVWIGRASYSLYLWHWPIFSFVDYRMVLASNASRLAMKVLLSAAAATISFVAIENPSRKFLNRPHNRLVAFSALAIALTVCVPLGIHIRRTGYVASTRKDISRGGLEFNSSGKKGSVVLLGESNASMYAKMMRDIAYENSYKLNVLSVDSGDPLPLANEENRQLWNDSLSAVKTIKPDYLFIACHWTSRLKDNKERLKIAIAALQPFARRIVLFTQPPALPEGASRPHMREGSRPPFLANQRTMAEVTEMNDYLRSLRSPSVLVIDVQPEFLTSDGAVLYLDQDGHQLYQDAIHLSSYGAERIKSRVLYAISLQ